MEIIRAGTVQFEHKNADIATNLSIIENFIKQASRQDVQLIVFPECCVTGYWFLRKLAKPDIHKLAEPIGQGSASRQIMEWAKRYSMMIGAGLLEAGPDGKFYNSYLVALPDGRYHVHRKLHTFISPHLSSGDHFLVFDTPYGWKASVLICYDNNIVENTRAVALMGADILLAPHQTGGCDSISPRGMKRINRKLWDERHESPKAIEKELCGPNGREWLLRWLPARAHDNGMFILFSNGIGVDDDEVRSGNAMIIDPYGGILAETWKAGDCMVIAELDPAILGECTGRRWMRARRPELYKILNQPLGIECSIRAVRFGQEN